MRLLTTSNDDITTFANQQVIEVLRQHVQVACLGTTC